MSLIPSSTSTVRTPGLVSTSLSSRANALGPALPAFATPSSTRFPEMPSFEIASRRCSGSLAYRSASTSGQRRFVSIVVPTDDVIESPSVATVSTCRGAVDDRGVQEEPCGRLGLVRRRRLVRGVIAGCRLVAVLHRPVVRRDHAGRPDHMQTHGQARLRRHRPRQRITDRQRTRRDRTDVFPPNVSRRLDPGTTFAPPSCRPTYTESVTNGWSPFAFDNRIRRSDPPMLVRRMFRTVMSFNVPPAMSSLAPHVVTRLGPEPADADPSGAAAVHQTRRTHRHHQQTRAHPAPRGSIHAPKSSLNRHACNRLHVLQRQTARFRRRVVGGTEGQEVSAQQAGLPACQRLRSAGSNGLPPVLRALWPHHRPETLRERRPGGCDDPGGVADHVLVGEPEDQPARRHQFVVPSAIRGEVVR